VEPLDQVFQNTAVTGFRPLINLVIFAFLGSFFLGALVTAVRRGIKEEGWFNLKKKEENN
tara:strand:+ start:51 stop:230 length:180 start_codon:yes stop_codon:yes gene_type:complete